MIKLLSEPHEIRQEIARVLLSGAPARAAVAFWGQDAEKALAISRDMVKQCQLKIICDLESGACNPATIRKLIDADTQVRFLKKLHAKVYLGNGEAVIGSANASANGLGLEGREVGGSKEVCIVTNDEAVVSQCECWFTNMWESATKIEEDDLRGAELAWRLRRKHRPMVRDSDRDLLAALRSNMPSFANREIYVRVDMAEISKAAEKAAEDEIGGRLDLAWHI